ncbi:hypothetical protein GGTG_05266 [Gaeumannomyces tritici R3-111a-1]|uniref:Uncharacterized protein n=1 Tax=Gaeumannomyces tritici (strain R3-111a-1) TaxID=644352 RepID=J3NVF2_GAET3|nr:hypothetical protein GGTG_05266 [Gaeumannomyces tritici R3-111a-1]EJT75329.1 hypothetical protein GGTG_05266 [Gaeumannomyces tritici R3-111a-1]
MLLKFKGFSKFGSSDALSVFNGKSMRYWFIVWGTGWYCKGIRVKKVFRGIGVEKAVWGIGV